MIVWLASYPRSGNTFMRVLLKSYFGLKSYSQYNDIHDIGKQRDFANIVGHDMYSEPWEDFYKKSTESNDLKIIKTHHAPIDAAKTIYLVRDPRSVVVSLHNYLQNFSPLDLNRRDTIMGATAFGSWGQHITNWQPTKRDDTLVVHFERLTKEPSVIADEVAEFLGIDKTGDDIPTFSELHDINSSFFNTGSDKKNISTLQSEELNLLTFLFKDQMKLMGYEHSERTNRAKALDSIMGVSHSVWSLQHEIRRQREENSKRLGDQKQRLSQQHSAELEKTRGEQRQFIDQLVKSIQSSGVQAEALAKQSIALTEKFESTNERLQDLWSQKSELMATITILRNQRAELQEALATAKERYEQLNTQNSALMTKEASHFELQKETETLKAEIQNQNSKLESKEVAYFDLQKEAEQIRVELQTQRAQASREIQQLGERLEEMEIEKKKSDASQLELQREAEKLKAEIQNQNSKLDSKESAYLGLQKEAEQMRTELQAKSAEANREIQQLVERLEEMRIEKKRSDAKITYRGRALESARISLAAAKATYDARSGEVERLTNQIQEEQKRIDRFQVFVTDLTSQKIEREKFIKQLEGELETALRKAVNLSNRNQELQAKYALTRDQFMEVSQAVAPRIKSILTLKPIRYVANRRTLVKRGDLVLDEYGVPVPNAVEFETPEDVKPTTVNSGTARASTPKGSGHNSSIYQGYLPKKPLGVAVYTFDRTESVENVLESLHLQDGLDNTHVWIDGDQGNPKKRARLDQAEKCVSSFPVKHIHRNRGNYGFRKMMIVSMRKMFEMYDHVLFLEDDCFPTRHALNGFSYELDKIEENPNIFSVYGHPFLTKSEKEGPIGRFQGWGWATTRDKLMPLWPKLLDTYLMSEDEYQAFMERELTKDVLAHLDVTPGRQPSSTLPKFFAWDETLGFLAAQEKLTHKSSSERLVYNFGVGESSTHFENIEHYRRPPFNMVTIDEIWSHY
ncbi:MAG: sulfotransferase domain-containing protein [Pseudomonadota bacterium]